MPYDYSRKKRKIRIMEEEERRGWLRSIRRAISQGRMYPLNAPGMPLPGPDFLDEALFRGCTTKIHKGKTKSSSTFEPGPVLKQLYGRALREPGFTLKIKVRPGYSTNVNFVPGHIWGQHMDRWSQSQADLDVDPLPVDGPHPADVFILGKMPWKDETAEGRNLVGASGEILIDLLNKLRVPDISKWYVSNLIKFMPPDDSSNIRASWIADCLPLLHQELRIVRPKYILCLGADASKVLLGKQFNVSYMEGRVAEHSYPVHVSVDDEPEIHRCLVMTVIHPAQVARAQSQDLGRVLERGLSRWALLTRGERFDLVEHDIDHRVLDTYEDAVEWVQEVNHQFSGRKKKDKLISWDAEWQELHPMNAGAYLRTVQASWGPKQAVCFKLRHAGGKIAFRDRDGKPAIKRLMKLLQEFSTDKRAVGHFFVSDLEWLIHEGFNPIRDCPIPLDAKDGKEAWERLRDGEGWLDTAMMAHAIEETAYLGLEGLVMRYTTVPRYDIALEDKKEAYCKERGIKVGALPGFGEFSDKVLCPYANYDADSCGRLVKPLSELLDCDYEGNCAWEPFWESMIIQPVILEIHQTGILVDRQRIDDLTDAFLGARISTEVKIKEWARWPEFNIRSTQQVREFLFGERLNGKRDKSGSHVRIRPRAAKSLCVEPLLDTSKPPQRWSVLKERGLAETSTPTTGKMVLSILAQDNMNYASQIGWVRDYRFLDQVLKSVLRPPNEDDDGGWMVDDSGFWEYDAGLAACIDIDGRVRTHLYPTAETGRWKSARPNLQNMSKQRDDDYERMLGKDGYKHKLRSILMASKGCALIEFDYTGAELYGMAIMAGDANMIDHCQRALLSEDDPNYYDIHSNVAVLAFGLHCRPTKSALKSAGMLRFRTLAKNVIFGIAYGRGAKAIALQAKENRRPGDPEVSVDDAQAVIDTVFSTYPGMLGFFDEARRRAVDEKWLCHCFGRFRRFPTTSDYKLEGEFERQAMNFPVQGLVASAVDRGLARLQHARDHEIKRPDLFRILLQIHDAGLLEAPFANVEYLARKGGLIEYAMRDCVPIYPTNLAGVPTGAGPYYLGLDVSVEKNWGERFSKEECEEFGIPICFAG
jgi:uracil-DNA glycosylase family 4